MGTDALATLAAAELHQLTALDLSTNQLDAQAVVQLVKGNWPLLVALFLNDNLLDADAMSHLARGAWPCLDMLWLHDNRISSEGINLLTTASWPQLERLSIDATILFEDTGNMFSLLHASGPYIQGWERTFLARSQSLSGHWPELRRSTVMNDVRAMPCTTHWDSGQ